MMYSIVYSIAFTVAYCIAYSIAIDTTAHHSFSSKICHLCHGNSSTSTSCYIYIVYIQSTYWYSLVLSCTLDATIYILVLTTAPRLAALSLPLENLKSGHNICIQPMVFLGSGHRERRGIWWWCHPRGCLGAPDVATSAATWTEERHHCQHSSRSSSVEQEVVAWK